MEQESKQPVFEIGDDEPFKIVHNARKNSKHLKSTAVKSRKNSTISEVQQKQKKIKKKTRKLTQYINQDEKWYDQLKQYSQKAPQNYMSLEEDPFIEFQNQAPYVQQKFKQEKEEFFMAQHQNDHFCFMDHQVEKGIMEGIGDVNSLERELSFDFFNPENKRK